MNNEDLMFYKALCEFLEDNISKLEVLKLASHDKYNQMNKLLIDYQTVAHTADKAKMKRFTRQIEECFVDMRHDERSAIIANTELLGVRLARDYMRALGEPIIAEP